MPYFMYISISDEDKLLIFNMSPDDGSLEPIGEVALGGRPAPMAVDPQRKFLYVGRRGSAEISSFSIDQATGQIAHIGVAPLESEPCYLSTDRKGRYLLSSYYQAGHAAVHPIGPDGVVRTLHIEWLATDTGAHSIQTDRSNRFAFLPHIAGAGPNMILQFRFDEATGRLTPNSPHKFVPEREDGPRHFCFHPSMDIIYFSNEQGCSVTAYSFDSSAGTLSPFQTISTLPQGYQGNNSCSQIQVSPNGKFLFAPNRGHNSIACFAVDPTDGRLTSIAQVPTEEVPRAFSLDPEGKYLYAAGLESGKLASYRIDSDSGNLEPLDVYHVGNRPMWVLITKTGV